LKNLNIFLTVITVFFLSITTIVGQHTIWYVDSTVILTTPLKKSDLSFINTDGSFCNQTTYGLTYAHYYDIAFTSDSIRYGYKTNTEGSFPVSLYSLNDPVPPAFIYGTEDLLQPFQEDTLIQGLTCDTLGNIYAAGKGITIDQPVAQGVDSETYLGDLPLDLHCQGDLTMYNGKLYMVAIGNKLVEVNLQNPSLSQVIWEFTPDVLPIHGLATFKVECDSSVTYAIGKAADYSTLYRIDYENQTLIEICDVPDKVILGAASYSECAPAPCDIILDLDADNSSGGVLNDFVADISCVPPIAIVDIDVNISSEPGKLDSITIELSGILDNGFEYLTLTNTPNLNITGDGTTRITLINANGSANLSDFEMALSNVLYQNDAALPTYGTRDALFIAYSTVYESEPTIAWITLSNEALQFAYSIDSPACFGDDNGSITVSTSGGLAPYSYEWFDSQMDSTIGNLSEGDYSFTVTDADGCQRADMVMMTEPDTLIATIETINGDIICDNSGELSAMATGGTMPYTYLWNDGFDEQTNSQLSAGNYLLTITDANGCMDFSEYQLIEDTIFVNQQEQLCTGETFDFNSETFDTDTSLCVTFIAVNGCDSIHCLDLQFVDTTYTELFEEICFGENYDFNGLILENDTALCQTFTTINGCDSIICLNLTILENTTQLTDEFCEGGEYNFNGIELTEGGIYLDTFPAFNGCDSLIILNLVMNPEPVFSFDVEGNLCLDDAVTVTFNPDNEYLWATGETTNILTFTEAGVYDGIAINSFNCEINIEFTVDESSDLDIFYTAQNPACFGDLFGSILIDSIVGGISPYLFALDGAPLQANNEFENLLAGSYELLVEDASGCQAATTITLSEPQLLTIETSDNQGINLGETVDLFLSTNISNPIVQWSPSDYLACDTCLMTTAVPLQSIEYQITIVNENGCAITDEVEILVNNITGAYVPNVFSPNNDGINDYFSVFADGSIALIATFRIFDRWGGLLFETKDILPNDETAGWNGLVNGELLDSGVYIYFIEVVRVDGVKEILKGDVLLVR
jgi:gliding motility-associated-like protein